MESVRQPPRPPVLDQLGRARLTWFAEVGVGYFPVTAGDAPYDQAYFDQFCRSAATPLGQALMNAREVMVARHWRGPLIDVGIGSGAFVALRNGRGMPTFGYDVNPAGLQWLASRGLYRNPERTTEPVALSFWDVLEHMPRFDRVLAHAQDFVFASLPIFRDVAHILASKHYKKNEHCWYFTAAGLIAVMSWLGFECMEQNRGETELGREDIGSFVFRRHKPAKPGGYYDETR